MGKPLLFIVIGTRPEIIKTYPLIAPLKVHFRVKVIFTGQHFLSIMSDEIFKDLQFPKPDYILKIKNFNHSLQIASMTEKVASILIRESPEAVLVQGDTNSTLAGALAAVKSQIKVIHIEAGARCFNKSEPEELNRILVDQMAFINITFSQESTKNLRAEKIDLSIHCFPNTIYETCSVIQNKLFSEKKLLDYKLKAKKYILVTIHRKTNLEIQSLKELFVLLNELSKEIEVVFFLHPKTKIHLSRLKINISKQVHILSPVNYKDFLSLMKFSSFIISDSGGVVDEANFLGIPLFIYRKETERADIVKSGGAIMLFPDLNLRNKLRLIDSFTKSYKPKQMIKYNFCKKIAQIIFRGITNEKAKKT